jgi:CRISPR-associated protein Cmr3
MTTQWWLIEPRDPLIVRDGRPFGPNPGARASSLEFPFPSTVAGGVRTRAGLDADGEFDQAGETLNAIKKIGVKGPLLARLSLEGEITTLLLPAPADAIVAPATTPESTSETERTHRYGRRRVLTPRVAPDITTNLPDGLLPVQLLTEPDSNKPETILGKPESRAPRYWTWASLRQWLVNSLDDKEGISLSNLGSAGPTREHRMHVSVRPLTQTAEDGALFQTSGLEFQHRGEGNSSANLERLAIAVQVDMNKVPERSLRFGLGPLGGERRLVRWDAPDVSSRLDLQLPDEVQQKIMKWKRCRVVLVTPAYFKGGYAPGFLCEPREGVTPRLRAVAVRRSQVVSGWDFAQRHPKPTRRLVAAGSVYWLELSHAGNDENAIQRWLNAVWMNCISDDEESRNDGFGLALLGSWTHPTGETQ